MYSRLLDWSKKYRKIFIRILRSNEFGRGRITNINLANYNTVITVKRLLKGHLFSRYSPFTVILSQIILRATIFIANKCSKIGFKVRFRQPLWSHSCMQMKYFILLLWKDLAHYELNCTRPSRVWHICHCTQQEVTAKCSRRTIQQLLWLG